MRRLGIWFVGRFCPAGMALYGRWQWQRELGTWLLPHWGTLMIQLEHIESPCRFCGTYGHSSARHAIHLGPR